jgi:hypothetical protein
MIDSSGAVGDLVAVDGPIFFVSELHKFHRDLANLADLDLEGFFGGDVLVPAESASGPSPVTWFVTSAITALCGIA